MLKNKGIFKKINVHNYFYYIIWEIIKAVGYFHIYNKFLESNLMKKNY